jgi:fatty-acyl-CoA synthase
MDRKKPTLLPRTMENPVHEKKNGASTNGNRSGAYDELSARETPFRHHYNPSLGLATPDPVALHARLRPQSLASIDFSYGRRWTYAQLQGDIQRAVTVFTGHGIARGDRVAVSARNSTYQLIAQLALMRLGAVFVPLNYRLSQIEIAGMLADCTPKVFYVDGDVSHVLPHGCREARLADFAEAVDAARPSPILPPFVNGDTCVMMYTSGTSGRPKGVMQTARTLLATVVNFSVLGEVDTNSVFLCDSPMFHVIGLVTQIWPPLMSGGAVAISPSFVPEVTNVRLADPDLKITHYFCVPQMAEALRLAPNFEPSAWATLKALFTGGAPIPPSRVRWWLDQGVCMVNGYGLTETSTVTGMPLDAGMIGVKAGSVGVPGPATAVRIIDERGVEVAVGGTGEVLVSGLNVTPGYWNQPKEKQAAFTNDGCWLRTGDVGRIDEDGFLFIVDRRKDVFISGGENVYPVQVEAALLEHPAVKDVAVVGVPDQRWGETGHAWIVLGQKISPPTSEELTEHCKGLIAKFKVPKTFSFVESLPRTGSGKVMKHVLRESSISGNRHPFRR